MATTAPTAAQRLADRIGQISPQRVRIMLDQLNAGRYGVDDESTAIIAAAARRNLATRLDRFWISEIPTRDGLTQVIDQAYQRVAFVAHADTARAWLAWYTGTPTPGAHVHIDYRVCACGRLSATHDSYNPDGTFAGIGNGGCAESRCERFRPVVDRPARFGE
ncbi:hypothetical protein AB0B88_16290 [Micromonospora haikouensis]|uniref:hypothetical protein n=1 Tax=Micromonospora haikouensis TaxID=686309 RepID=UPI0033E57FDF